MADKRRHELNYNITKVFESILIWIIYVVYSVRKKPYLNIIFILEINVCIKQYFKLRAVILRICSYETNFFCKNIKENI